MKSTNYFFRFLKFCVFSSLVCSPKIKKLAEILNDSLGSVSSGTQGHFSDMSKK